MSDNLALEQQELSRFLGRSWTWVLTFGILCLALGIVVLAWPKETVLVVAWLVGIYLVVAGIVQIVQCFAPDRSGGMRALFAISGVISVLLGLFAFRSVAHSVVLLAVIIGVGWLLNGTMELVVAFGDKGFPGRGWAIFSGILGIIGGIVILVWPAISLFVLFTFFGIWLIVIGCWQIFSAFRMRGDSKRLAIA
jgi:uncharacterized membrane protein HdeD (DUF308 family)